MKIAKHTQDAWGNELLKNLAHPGFELAGPGKIRSCPAFRSQFPAKFTENFLETFKC